MVEKEINFQFHFIKYFLFFLTVKFDFFQLRDTDDNLSTGSRILSRMITRAQHSKVILAIIFLAILVAVGLGIYFSFTG